MNEASALSYSGGRGLILGMNQSSKKEQKNSNRGQDRVIDVGENFRGILGDLWSEGIDRGELGVVSEFSLQHLN